MTDLRGAVELAGMVDSLGRLSSAGPRQDHPWVPTRIAMEAEDLVWAEFDPERPDAWPEEVHPTGALDAFVRIKRHSHILKFAKRWGPLRLCAGHGVPHGHDGGCLPARREPLVRWYYYVEQASLILRIASLLRGGRPVSREAWSAMFVTEAEHRPVTEGVNDLLDALAGDSSQIGSRFYLANVIDEWLQMGSVRPRFTWTNGQTTPELTLTSGTFGVLAVQLMVAASGASGLCVCDGCGDDYMRQGRMPQRGRRNYCERCRSDGTDERVRKQRQRT